MKFMHIEQNNPENLIVAFGLNILALFTFVLDKISPFLLHLYIPEWITVPFIVVSSSMSMVISYPKFIQRLKDINFLSTLSRVLYKIVLVLSYPIILPIWAIVHWEIRMFHYLWIEELRK